MAARPRTVFTLGAVALIVGYGGLIAAGMIRAPWASDLALSPELLAGINAGLILDTREGSRNANRTDDSVPSQAPLENIALFPENAEWWTTRCQGFFSALFRAELAATQIKALRDAAPIFPVLETLTDTMKLPDSSNLAAIDQMKRYERSFPFHPGEISGTPLYQIDLPVCTDVAQGAFPKRP